MVQADIFSELANLRHDFPKLRAATMADKPAGVKDSAWRVALRLAQGPACARDLYGHFNQRILELRSVGFVVDLRACTRHDHPEAPGLKERILVDVPEEWR